MNTINAARALTYYLKEITYGISVSSSFLISLVPIALSVVLLYQLLLPFPISYNALAQNQLQLPLQKELQPNLYASHIYQTQTMVLGKNIKNLVILIPNEGHEEPHATPKELRIINQPYVPQNAVVNVGITIAWLNAIPVISIA